MGIKKNFFAPLASGLGATRRAAMLLLVMMLTTATAWAQSGSCGDNLTWELTARTLTIRGEGAMNDYNPDINPAPWNNYAQQIREVVIENGVTSIGDDAFWNCSNLATVTFAEDSQLATIGISAFSECSGLTSIEIPASVTSIGESAFNECTDLESVTFAEVSQLESIGNYAFLCCSNLTSITIPASVTSIGGSAFSGTGLTDVEIPASVTSIGERAFYECTDLESVTFAEVSELESIGNYAFLCCSNLTSITIPASVTSIGVSAFFECESLTSVTFAEGSRLESIGNDAFDDTGLTSIEIPASVTSIGNAAFFDCQDLTSVTFAEGSQLESIGNNAFQNCHNLTSITIPAGVTSIGESAFYATGLTSIEIPASVTSIGMRAFQNCPNLATVTVYAPSCTLGDNAFLNCNNLANIYVFSDLVDGYKDAENWSDYKPNPNGKCGDNVRWALTGESTNYTLTITGSGAMADYSDSSVQPWKDYRSSIKTVVIGAGVTSLGKYTFYGCTSLTSINIPASVTSIGNYTFSKCSGLTSIEIPASVTSIGDNAFWDCSNLATVTFAEDSQLATIGISAFSSCRGLASVEIPASVTSIGDNAFHYCSGLATVSFAAGSQLTSIGDNAFEYCSGLIWIEIPASVTSIGRSAFASCSNLEAMIVDGGNTVYDSRNGCNAIIEKSSNTLIAGCKNTTIPDGVTSIRMRAFYGCTGLASIEIPASVTSIGDNAFANCSNLEAITVEDGNAVYDSRNGCNAIIKISSNTLIAGCKNTTIPDGVTSIGESAFSGTGLTSIEIPASVTSIGNYAFQNCPNLATVTVYAPSCTLGANAFADCDKLTKIYVFSDKVASYKAATNWKNYAGKITALPTVTTSYVDATGTLHEGVEAVPLNNAMTTLSAGWYVVNSDINYTGTITLNGDVNIILADGKTMSVTNTGTGNVDFAIYGDSGSLHIYGQSQGTGALDVTGTNYGILYYAGNVVIRGGTVNATGTNNIGIYANGYITITGGQVTATGDEAGIYSDDGNITLGWTSASDFITAESYSASLGIIVKAGQTLTDGISTYSGTLTDEQKIAIAEKVLTPPTYSVTANRATTQDTEYWSTFYHPAAGYTADENTTVYQAAVNTTTNKVELTAVPGREIPADKAVVLKSTQSAITLSRATTTQTLDVNELKGGATVADGTVPYTLAANGGTVGFYKFVGAALNPNKAHLEITAPAQSAPAFLGFEENTTAINEHELHESHELSGAWYSLDGRKLSGKPSVKGIYVRNGRKFIIK